MKGTSNVKGHLFHCLQEGPWGTLIYRLIHKVSILTHTEHSSSTFDERTFTILCTVSTVAHVVHPQTHNCQTHLKSSTSYISYFCRTERWLPMGGRETQETTRLETAPVWQIGHYQYTVMRFGRGCRFFFYCTVIDSILYKFILC